MPLFVDLQETTSMRYITNIVSIRRETVGYLHSYVAHKDVQQLSADGYAYAEGPLVAWSGKEQRKN